MARSPKRPLVWTGTESHVQPSGVRTLLRFVNEFFSNCTWSSTMCTSERRMRSK